MVLSDQSNKILFLKRSVMAYDIYSKGRALWLSSKIFL